MASRDLVELELTNGMHLFVVNDWDRVYGLYEKSCTTMSLSKKFPFIAVCKRPYTVFRMRIYQNTKSMDDPCYKVNCTLVQLASMFGVRVKTFDQAVTQARIEEDLGQ